MIQCQINVCKGLCLNSLCRIHDENGTITCSKTSADLVVEVHMSRSVNQVENIFLTILRFINRPDGLCLNRDSTFSFQIHVVKYLCLHFTAGQKPRLFYDTVCKRRLTMINMRYNAEIPDFALINM